MSTPVKRLAWLLLAAAVYSFAASAAAGEMRRKMSQTWSVEASYPEFGNKTVDEGLREWLNALIAEIMDSVKDYADVEDAESSFSSVIEYEIVRPSEQAASVAFTIFTYPSGAAHPSAGFEVKNVLLSESRFLGLNDLFENSDLALTILAQHAPKGVMEYLHEYQPGKLTDDFNLTEDEWFLEGSEPKRENYECLLLEPGGVRVIFQLYQVLPYIFGAPEFVVPLGALAPAGPNPKIWPHIADSAK